MIDETTTSDIPPMLEGVFTQPKDGKPPRLLGGYCPACDRWYFPRPAYCRSCLGSVEEKELGSEGELHSFTVVRTRPPLGLPQPYAVGYVDLAGVGLRVFCLLDPARIDELAMGMQVRLEVAPLGADGAGRPRLRPYFTPSSGGSIDE